jgi:hypothetical protein
VDIAEVVVEVREVGLRGDRLLNARDALVAMADAVQGQAEQMQRVRVAWHGVEDALAKLHRGLHAAFLLQFDNDAQRVFQAELGGFARHRLGSFAIHSGCRCIDGLAVLQAQPPDAPAFILRPQQAALFVETQIGHIDLLRITLLSWVEGRLVKLHDPELATAGDVDRGNHAAGLGKALIAGASHLLVTHPLVLDRPGGGAPALRGFHASLLGGRGTDIGPRAEGRSQQQQRERRPRVASTVHDQASSSALLGTWPSRSAQK